MSIVGSTRPLLVLAGLLALAGCAGAGGTSGAGTSDRAVLPAGADALVLQVEFVGGFTTPELLAARLPLISVYADGRVITEGPVAAVHPGPALPNLLVTRIAPSRVQELADRALVAGVAETGDLGSPPVADVPSTRFTLVTEDGPIVREVYALSGEEAPGPPGSGVTPEQAADRSRLRDLQNALTDLGAGADQQPYAPQAIAAVVRPWVEPDDEPSVDAPGGEVPGSPQPELPQAEVSWPGPALPGEEFVPELELGCVTADGPEATAVLDAARPATALTPWVGDDGTRWALTLRPLLPHETGCADLRDR